MIIKLQQTISQAVRTIAPKTTPEKILLGLGAATTSAAAAAFGLGAFFPFALFYSACYLNERRYRPAEAEPLPQNCERVIDAAKPIFHGAVESRGFDTEFVVVQGEVVEVRKVPPHLLHLIAEIAPAAPQCHPLQDNDFGYGLPMGGPSGSCKNSKDGQNHLQSMFLPIPSKDIQIHAHASNQLFQCGTGELLECKERFNEFPYDGIVILDPGSQEEELAGARDFPSLFKAAFFSDEKNTEYFQINEKTWKFRKRIIYQHEILSTSPEQLIISLERSQHENFKVTGINDMLEVPRSYFLDDRDATYRLDAVTLYIASREAICERRWDPATKTHLFFLYKDGIIIPINREPFLECAERAHLFRFTKTHPIVSSQ